MDAVQGVDEGVGGQGWGLTGEGVDVVVLGARAKWTWPGTVGKLRGARCRAPD